MPGNVLDFEKPIAQLEEKIAQVKRLTREEGIDRSHEIAQLEAAVERLRREIYQNLTPWDKTLIARHPARPFTLDYVRVLCEDMGGSSLRPKTRSAFDLPATWIGYGASSRLTR